MLIRGISIIFTLAFSISLAHADDPIKVGLILPLSGDMAAFGKIVQDGIKQADSSGLQLIYEDDACLPAKSVSALRKLLDVDRVSYIVGPACGSPQRSVAPLIARSNAIAMLPNSRTRELFRLSQGKIYSPQYSIEAEASFNARQMYALGSRRVAMIFYEDVFCRKHEEAFRKSFQGEVVDVLALNSLDASSLKPLLTRISTLKVDSLYVPDVSPFLLGLRREMAKYGLASIRTFSVFSAQLDDVLRVEGSYADGLVYSYPAIAEKDAISYFPRLGARLLFDAIRSCKKDTACVARHLRANNSFDESGVFEGAIELREVRNGRFQRHGVEQ